MCGTQTLTQHDRTRARLGNLMSIQPESTMKVNKVFPALVLSRYSSELETKIFSFSFPKTKQNNTVVYQFGHSLLMAISCTQVHFPPFPPSSSI